MLMFSRRFLLLFPSASLIAAALSGCASAPAAKPPIVTPEEKLARMIRLEDQRILRETPPPPPVPQKGRRTRVPPPPPPPDLLPLLGDPDPLMRRRAALAVGRVGLVAGVQPLLPLLKDADPDVRQMAAFALGLIGDRSASAPLQAALTDTSYVVRGRAAEALGQIGDAASAPPISTMAKEAAEQGNVAALPPDLERYPMDPPAAEAFRLGIEALVRLKAYDALAAAVLDPSGRPITQWWPVAYSLSRIEDPRAVPALTMLLNGPGTYTRAFAARGLGLAKTTAAVERLLGLVKPDQIQPLLAVAAERALAQIGGQGVGEALVAVVNAPNVDPSVRLEAVTALGVLKFTPASEVVADLVADPWPAMRAQALRALAEMDPRGFLFALSGLDPDPHWSVRAAIAGALTTQTTELAAPRLSAMLSDADRRVVPAVLAALVKVKAPDAEAILRKHLEDPDVVIRMTAARELGALKPADGANVFAQAYRQWSADNTYLARAAALTSLASYGTAATDTLKAALTDREWAVRVKALELLRGIDAPAADPLSVRPAPTNPAIPYDAPDLIAPQFSPHLYVETTKGLIEIELAVREAPLTSQTIMALARRGFFTGISFHRVVPNFVVQAGDPRGDGEGGPNFTIRDERNDLPYLRGTVGMALDWRDTGGSQFFITHSPQPHLDARYTVFGRVVKGMEVVDALQQWDTIERVRVWDGVTLTGK